MVGASSLRYWEPGGRRAWAYTCPHGDRRWAHDATLLLDRSVWEAHRYPDLNHTLDVRWLSGLPAGSLLVDNTPTYVGLVHPGNTSRKNTSRPCWRQVPVEEVERLVGTDLADWAEAVGLIPAARG